MALSAAPGRGATADAGNGCPRPGCWWSSTPASMTGWKAVAHAWPSAACSMMRPSGSTSTCSRSCRDPAGAAMPKARVVVHEHLDGTLSVTAQGERLAIQCLTPTAAPDSPRARSHPCPATRPSPQSASRKAAKTVRIARPRPRWRSAHNHPWRELTAQAVQRKQLREGRGDIFAFHLR